MKYFAASLLALSLCFNTALAQTASQIDDFFEGVFAIDLAYSNQMEIEFLEAPGDASDVVTGYTNILPSKTTGNVTAISFVLTRFKVFITHEESVFKVNTLADINQIPTDPTDDVFVKGVRRENQTIGLLFGFNIPFGKLELGFGRSQGTMKFSDKASSSGSEVPEKFKKTFGIENNVFIIAPFFGTRFDQLPELILGVNYTILNSMNRKNFQAHTRGPMLELRFSF